MIEVSQGVRTGEYQLSHVADVEKPRGGTHCHMLGDDPGGVLYRQEVSRKGDDLAAQRLVAAVEGGLCFHALLLLSDW